MKFFVRTIALIFLSSLTLQCPSVQKREYMETGAWMEEIQSNGLTKYKVRSIGLASQLSIDRKNPVMMNQTSCDAAKLQALSKISEIESNRVIREQNSKKTSELIYFNGKYCSQEYIFTPN